MSGNLVLPSGGGAGLRGRWRGRRRPSEGAHRRLRCGSGGGFRARFFFQPRKKTSHEDFGIRRDLADPSRATAALLRLRLPTSQPPPLLAVPGLASASGGDQAGAATSRRDVHSVRRAAASRCIVDCSKSYDLDMARWLDMTSLKALVYCSSCTMQITIASPRTMQVAVANHHVLFRHLTTSSHAPLCLSSRWRAMLRIDFRCSSTSAFGSARAVRRLRPYLAKCLS